MKLQAGGVHGTALKWLSSFLKDRMQATLVDGTLSPFEQIHAGVPQGAILSPLLFSVYVNDIPSDGSTNLFADDTSSFVTTALPSLLPVLLQDRVDSLNSWFNKWLLAVNGTKSAVMVFRSTKMKHIQMHITVNSMPISQVTSHRHLGIVFSENLSWSSHVDSIVTKASSRLGLLRRLRQTCSSPIILDLYCHCIRPILEYGHIVWCGLSRSGSARLERCNRAAARLITRIRPDDKTVTHELLLARAGLPALAPRRALAKIIFCRRYFSTRLPDHLLGILEEWLPGNEKHAMIRRRPFSVRLPRPKKNVLKKSPLYLSFSLWNSIPAPIQTSPTTTTLTQYLLTKADHQM